MLISGKTQNELSWTNKEFYLDAKWYIYEVYILLHLIHYNPMIYDYHFYKVKKITKKVMKPD